jgi:glyoxylase-like metal-dependent hydrolase (beta-lactamase superfamily II)
MVSPIFAHPHAKIGLEECNTIDLSDGMAIAPDLMVVTIDGAAPGEIALHWAAEGGTLIFGDALINMGSNGFSFLPNKYCLNPKLMRRSLQKVLDYPCERILFAHGTPIVSQAKSRLTNLLRDS